MLKFNKQKIVFAPHMSDIIDVLPAIRFYIETERITDYNALAISCQWIIFQFSVFIRLKRKKNIETNEEA